jgi:hypothetical protein
MKTAKKRAGKKGRGTKAAPKKPQTIPAKLRRHLPKRLSFLTKASAEVSSGLTSVSALSLLRVMVLVALVAGPLVAENGTPTPELKFRNATVKLGGEGEPRPVTLVVEATNLPPVEEGKTPPELEIADVGSDGPEGLTVEYSEIAELPGPDGATRYWKTLLTVRGIEPDGEVTRLTSPESRRGRDRGGAQARQQGGGLLYLGSGGSARHGAGERPAGLDHGNDRRPPGHRH